MSALLPSQWTYTTNQDANQLLVGSATDWIQNAYQPWSFTNPGGDNNTLRFEVRAGDHWQYDVDTRQRSEIANTKVYAPGTDIHLSYDFMIEPGAANTASWMVIGDWHHTGTDWSSPLEVDLSGERMAIRIDTAGNNANDWSQYHTVWTDPQNIVRGHYYHMDMQVRFDPTNGYLHVERDGVTLVDYHGPLGWSTMGSGVYWKEGIYRAASDTTIAADYRNLSITTGSAPAPAPAPTPKRTMSSSPK